MAIVVVTREKAIEVLTTHWAACQDAFGLVAALEELGLLHIERTKPDFTKKLVDQMSSLGVHMTQFPIDVALDRAGLKIVEK